MTYRIPFKEGSYIIDDAYFVTPRKRSVQLVEGILEVYRDGAGTKHLRGRAFVNNSLMVALLEDEDSLDLVLDLGPGFRYRLPQPLIQAGKVFEPRTWSIVHFAPSKDLLTVPDPDYDALLLSLHVLQPSQGPEALVELREESPMEVCS